MHRVGRIYNNIPHVLPSLAKEINRVSLIWGMVHNGCGYGSLPGSRHLLFRVQERILDELTLEIALGRQ
jgi:hypothetical protein